MSDEKIDPVYDGVPEDPPGYLKGIVVGEKTGVTWLNGGYLRVIMREPLPGIVIFVHGVNSDGEWYTAAEKGLCEGLNDRLKRRDEHMAYPTPEGGQLTPATYLPELTADGFINPEIKFNNFIGNDEHFTPVIHFRWGYKANPDELQEFGEGVYLNEENYWGGGPFANGCTSLPDLWQKGLSDNLLLWMQIEHLNPTDDRIVFSCPPRPYYVIAALRLAKLIAAIRSKQADVPITIVCHSQGNMVSMAAAFLGDAMAPVKDSAGLEGRCVADSYVLCNPPYSLAPSNFTETFTSGSAKDRRGGTGRQTHAARIGTLRAFFDIIRKPASRVQQPENIDTFMANERHGFNIATDRMTYGYGIQPTTCGRVTLYCNPHDQVISSTSVMGIGWRGVSKKEIDAAGGTGIFCQRVFAQGHTVGEKGTYHYWRDQYNRPQPGSEQFWVPESLKARYGTGKGLDANKGRPVAKIFTTRMEPVMVWMLSKFGPRINALPDNDWEVPLDAPNLPDPFKPQSVRFGAATEQFDQGYDAPGQSRDKERVHEADDPYAGDRHFTKKERKTEGETTDAPLGDAASEASMRYEDHARLRMQARREGLVGKQDEHVMGEDKPQEASAEYTAWRNEKIKTFLAKTVDTHATDHSTIMTNPMHAQKALAYDIAIGHCHIRDKHMHAFRIAADWRFLKGLDDTDPSKVFLEYFEHGTFKKHSAFDWAHLAGSEGYMPDKIVDERQIPPSPEAQN